MLPVVVGSYPNSPWLADCLSSIRETTDREPFVFTDGGYEVPALRYAVALDMGPFLFLPDSTVVLTEHFWTAVDAGTPQWLFGWPGCYLAVFDPATLVAPLERAPLNLSKQDAIDWEWKLRDEVPMPTLWPDVRDANALRSEERHGRLNLIIGNTHVEKWKGHW